eukprot:scaffold12924_cov91-Phaeocystis_antarctica.AAC.1
MALRARALGPRLHHSAVSMRSMMAHRKCAALKLIPSVGDSCGQQAPWAGAAASRNQRSGHAGGDNGGVRQISAVSTGWHGAGGDDGGDGGDNGGEGGRVLWASG